MKTFQTVVLIATIPASLICAAADWFGGYLFVVSFALLAAVPVLVEEVKQTRKA